MNEQHDFLRSIGFNIEQFIKDYDQCHEEQYSYDYDILDHLFAMNDEKFSSYIKKNLLFHAEQVTDQHGSGVMEVVKEIIGYSMIKKDHFPTFTIDKKKQKNSLNKPPLVQLMAK